MEVAERRSPRARSWRCRQGSAGSCCYVRLRGRLNAVVLARTLSLELFHKLPGPPQADPQLPAQPGASKLLSLLQHIPKDNVNSPVVRTVCPPRAVQRVNA